MNSKFVLLFACTAGLVLSGCTGKSDAQTADSHARSVDADAIATSARPAVKTVGRGCDTTAVRQIESAAYAATCFKPRTGGNDVVGILVDSRDFATNCPVSLTKAPPPPPTDACYATTTAAESIIASGDELFVHQWRDGSFSLTVRRGTQTLRTVNLDAGPAVGGGTPYLIGEDADAHYAVYIANSPTANGAKPKTYRLEVFAKQGVVNAAKCLEHLPSFANATVTCLSSGTSGSQTSSSGGTEPPPR